MSFVIRNISGGTVSIGDLGLELASGEDYNLSQESPNDINQSDDLRTRINASEIVVLEPLTDFGGSPHTTLTLLQSLKCMDIAADSGFRIFGGEHDQLDDTTITSVADNHTLKYNSGSGQWVNVPGLPPPPVGGSLIAQLFWGPIPAVVGTTIIPNDLTIPLLTEGTELWTQNITLLDSSSTVRIATNCTTSSSSASIEFVFSVFRDSLCVGTAVNATSNKDSGFAVSFEIYDTPLITGNVTYSVRVGKSGGGGTWSINEIGGEALFAGTLEANSFSIEEIQVVA